MKRIVRFIKSHPRLTALALLGIGLTAFIQALDRYAIAPSCTIGSMEQGRLYSLELSAWTPQDPWLDTHEGQASGLTFSNFLWLRWTIYNGPPRSPYHAGNT
jgi:hypothetical protein